MRKCGLLLVALLALVGGGIPLHQAASQSLAGLQVIFLGDRTCLDSARDCRFPAILARHRYLHVILHDLAGNDDWQVQIAPDCGDTMPPAAGGQAIGADGFLEVVVDLAALQPSPAFASACYVFRGRNHWAVTYYAAYLDDTAIPDSDTLFPGYQSQDGRPALPDLDVLYIHRSPAYAYDAAKNTPAPGERVVFTAHVANAGARPVGQFFYSWSVDEKQVREGSVSMPVAPGQEVTLSLPWRWRTGAHEITVQTAPVGDEISTTNNQLAIRTDALALGFWVEQSAVEYFDRFQWTYCEFLPCAGSDSFGDWLQRQVAAWNGILASAVYPALAPTGVADRVRLDDLVVVPDGTLPLHGGRATNTPDLGDRTVDLEWGLPAAGVAAVYPHQWEGRFDVDWATIHELGHARSLADMYRFDIGVQGDSSIAVTDAHGRPVYDPVHPLDPDSKLHTFTANVTDTLLYQNQEQDLMSCTCTPQYSAYTALVLNRIRGERARCGNVNAPCNLGDWFLDLPTKNELRVVDGAGRPLPDGTTVRVFYDGSASYTGHSFREPDSSTVTMSNGLVSLGADPFRAHGSRSLAGHNLLLLEIDPAKTDLFCFIEPTTFNLAGWLGYRTATQPAVYTLRIGDQRQNSCMLHLPPARVNEPFATSPLDSQVQVGPQGPKSRRRTIVVRLRDDARPPHAMRNRRVRVIDGAGHQLGTGETRADGSVRFDVPASAGRLRIEDTTDNGLIIPSGFAGSPAPADHRRR
jgi:hypothetical protein